ncbi:sensor histidine kinase [Micromonospora robiginosa]|uniref:histidine kinase n=1 Tax=Micromonospora robiginosa TaxID=2749844 RepID=A0A7L6B562_9ACTN|nr:histidine kinase [Micromonospora ferruginea]QLQ37093.2 sensor domain-containing protein [Micromonospora ferruginea]
MRVLLRTWLRPAAVTAAQGLLTALLSLTTHVALVVLSVVALLLIPAFGIGIALFPVVTAAVRGCAGLHRRLARWSGVEMATPYLPAPAGAPFGTWRRFRWVVGDPATWRDLAWLLPGAVTGAVCLAPLALPMYGLEGLIGLPLVLHTAGVDYGYGPFWPIHDTFQAVLCFPLGALLLAVGVAAGRWPVRLHVRFAGFFLRPTRGTELALRVRQLTVTRAEAVDAQAAELRRIERDLHDGAQARLVALSMSIGLAEQLVRDDPEAVRRLLAEARETSGQALAELRGLVRGIHPPVLAERGLPGAVRALALAVPLPVDVTVDLPGRPAAPVESAVYFAVAEALANVGKHSGATRAWVELGHAAGRLTAVVGDDGRGGASSPAGGGLAGTGRRLAAFDGTMTVTSPTGGPTVISMELPCALSSPRISPSSGTG